MPPHFPTHTLSMAYAYWPAADRQAWESLFLEGDVLEDGGPVRHWRSATCECNRLHYGRWLRWLAVHGKLDPSVAPWARVMPEAVQGYAEHLLASVAPRTAASRLVGLVVVIRAMRPEESWRWLMDLANRLCTWAEPSVDRSVRIRPIEEVHSASLRELERLTARQRFKRADRLAFRDTLIVLLLSAAPVRRRNLASIEIGRHLILAPDRATLYFPETETKNRQRLVFDLPRSVIPWIMHYLDQVRPSFSPEAGCSRLWVGFKGKPLPAKNLAERVVLVTRRLLGVPINPHSFRACAATSFALQSPDMARLAAPLLGHKYFGTTDRYYIIKANQLEASRRINATLMTLRGASRRKTRP